MYSKAAASQLKEAFWTTFGQYMSPMPGADGAKINWINYKTGIRYIRFTMDAGPDGASISILITAPDSFTRALYYDQLGDLRRLLEQETGEPWNWQPHATDAYGKAFSKIGQVLEGVSVYRKEDWPALISFFKPRIIALDAFWSNVRDGFEHL